MKLEMLLIQFYIEYLFKIESSAYYLSVKDIYNPSIFQAY